MNRLPSPLLLSAASLLLASSACARISITGEGHIAGFNEKATRTDELDLDMKPGDAVSFELGTGGVLLRASSTAKPFVKAKITAYGSDAADAARNLERCQLKVERSSSGVRVRVEAEPAESRSAGMVVRIAPEVRIEAAVPNDTPVSVETSSGNVDLRGPLGAVNVESSYGQVDLADVKGDVRATTRSGNIQVARVRGAKSLELRSGYGNIRATELEGARARIETTSGDVVVEEAATSELSVRSSYGRLSIGRVTGAVAAKTTSGDVTFADVGKGNHVLESGYGNITVRKTEGELRASTSSGNVAVRDFVGKIEASSNYGAVEIVGILDEVLARSTSGNLAISARAGSALQRDWSVQSGYGNVSVELPADVSCRVDAKTSHGTIDSDFSVTIEAGTKLKGGVLRGAIQPAAGGAAPAGTVTIRTSSGDIKILKSTR